VRLKPNAGDWPITLKVPLVVMLLMLAISFVISNSVLSRLAATQERNLQMLSRSYLAGLGATLRPYILREDVWEVFDTLERTRSVYEGLNAVDTIVFNADNTVIAASNPKKYATGQKVASGPLAMLDAPGRIVIDETEQTARMLRSVTLQGRKIGSIYTELNISALMNERQAVLWQLVLTNAALTVFLMAVGYWAVRRMVQPVRTLDAYLERSSDGPMKAIPDAELDKASGEFRRLFRRYNAMARAANERFDLTRRLAQEERLASLGRLASGMAHDINNPLGGLFNTLSTLKRYGDQDHVRLSSINLLERGLKGIRDAVRATLMTYRRPNERGAIGHDDLEDLRYLIKPALRQKSLILEWDNQIDRDLPLAGYGLRDASLNLLMNACNASPEGGKLSFCACAFEGHVEIAIADQGPGLPDPYKQMLEARGEVGPPKAGQGLGLWMVRRFLHDLNGTAQVQLNDPGTTVRLIVPLQAEEERHVA